MAPPTTTRGAQPTSTGLGHHFVSPKKSRDKKKTQTTVQIPGAASKHSEILARISELMKPQAQDPEASSFSSTLLPQNNAMVVSEADDTISHNYDIEDLTTVDEGPSHIADVMHEDTTRRLLPDKLADNLYRSWKALIPTLVDPQLKYTTRTHGQPLLEVCPVISSCTYYGCAQKRSSIVCLFFDRKY
jgi:hypothetical protein